MRACPTGNGKGACACSSDQVSNIRLWPLPREEHRGDARPDIAPQYAEKMMKGLLAASAMLILAGCSNADQKAQYLAHCRMKALSPEGLAFQKNTAAQSNQAFSPSTDDTPYRDYIETCMTEKGFTLVPVYYKNKPENSIAGCWIDDGKSAIPKANADSADCYQSQ
jgi:hypothetical protein